MKTNREIMVQAVIKYFNNEDWKSYVKQEVKKRRKELDLNKIFGGSKNV